MYIYHILIGRDSDVRFGDIISVIFIRPSQVCVPARTKTQSWEWLAAYTNLLPSIDPSLPFLFPPRSHHSHSQLPSTTCTCLLLIPCHPLPRSHGMISFTCLSLELLHKTTLLISNTTSVKYNYVIVVM